MTTKTKPETQEPQIVKDFNDFLKEWCSSYAHLIDNDDNDGERFRRKLRAAQPSCNCIMCCDYPALYCGACENKEEHEAITKARADMRREMLAVISTKRARFVAEGIAQGKKEEREAFKASFGWAADVKYWLAKRAELEKEAGK